jgi:hypothetical protein
MSRALKSLLTACGVLALAPAVAGADGLPVPMDGFGTTTVVEPGGDGPRYASVRAGEDTELLQINQDGGEITASRTVNGNFTIPLVAIDGTPSGLSADGRTLALISPRTDYDFPRRETSFVIVDIKENGAMRPQPPLTLRGDFSFDALSPDGEMMYLVEYLSRDYNDYAVREYDLRKDRLLPDPVLVAHEVSPGEMRGLPMTRATSPDGRWEYTLYDGGGGRNDEAFIHTLDTERGISHCVDLPMVSGQEAWRVGLELTDDGGTLNATRGDQTLAMLDTETFALTEPLAPELTVAPDGGDGPSGLAIGAIAVGTVLLVGTALGLRRRRRGAALPPDPFGPDTPAEPEPPSETAERAPERDRVSM